MKKFLALALLLLSIRVDATQYMYSSTIPNLKPAAGATDIFSITGAAGRTIRIMRIEFSGNATNASTADLIIVKRSAVDQAGASTTLTIVPLDSYAPASLAGVSVFFSNPTLGASVGNAFSRKVSLGNITATIPQDVNTFDFDNRNDRGLVLHAGEQACLNWNTQNIPGATVNVSVFWGEE